MPFSDLPARLDEIRERLERAVARGGHRQEVTIVAVTKTHGPEAVRAAYESALARGEGVVAVRGRMVDRPVYLRALATLARAGRGDRATPAASR